MILKSFHALIVTAIICTVQSCSSPKKITSSNGDSFKDIFDGKTLNGWEGDPAYWRVENGILTGEVTPQTKLKQNSFLIWKGGAVSDFELKVEYRISDYGNSGINYRSEKVKGIPFALKGYQADIDGKNRYGDGFPRYTGQNYEERGRQFLALRGQRVVIENGQKPKVIDSLGSKEKLLKSIYKNGWNEYYLVVKGNNMKHFINGMLMSEVTDNDNANRKMSGWLGVQVHVGPPMKVEFKNFKLKMLK
jgi:hypothetical protein